LFMKKTNHEKTNPRYLIFIVYEKNQPKVLAFSTGLILCKR
jgi:hypothetical protein